MGLICFDMNSFILNIESLTHQKRKKVLCLSLKVVSNIVTSNVMIQLMAKLYICIYIYIYHFLFIINVNSAKMCN